VGVNSLPKTVTRQHRDCDLNTGPSAPESSTLTTRLPGVGPSERNPVRTKAQQNEIPIERNPIRTKIRQKVSPTERKAQFEPVYNRLCVETVFAASVNVTTET